MILLHVSLPTNCCCENTFKFTLTNCMIIIILIGSFVSKFETKTVLAENGFWQKKNIRETNSLLIVPAPLTSRRSRAWRWFCRPQKSYLSTSSTTSCWQVSPSNRFTSTTSIKIRRKSSTFTTARTSSWPCTWGRRRSCSTPTCPTSRRCWLPLSIWLQIRFNCQNSFRILNVLEVRISLKNTTPLSIPN